MNLSDALFLPSSNDSPRQKLTLGWRGNTERLPDIRFVDVTEPAALPKLRMPHVVEVAPLDETSPLQICMNHWRDWMRQNDRDLGTKGQTGIVGGGSDEDEDQDADGYDDSAAAGDAAAHRASREIAMATDAMIDSLPRHFKAAIYRCCNISSVWLFPNLDFVAVLPQAEQELSEKLAKNVATRAFF